MTEHLPSHAKGPGFYPQRLKTEQMSGAQDSGAHVTLQVILPAPGLTL